MCGWIRTECRRGSDSSRRGHAGRGGARFGTNIEAGKPRRFPEHWEFRISIGRRNRRLGGQQPRGTVCLPLTANRDPGREKLQGRRSRRFRSRGFLTGGGLPGRGATTRCPLRLGAARRHGRSLPAIAAATRQPRGGTATIPGRVRVAGSWRTRVRRRHGSDRQSQAHEQMHGREQSREGLQNHPSIGERRKPHREIRARWDFSEVR